MATDLVEIFGYAPKDLTKATRSLWTLGACPFVNGSCVKHNHDKSIIYGTCSATSPYGDIIICPNRLYADNWGTIRAVAKDAFGSNCQFFMFDEFIKNRTAKGSCVVALGQNSGKEVKVGKSLSMDWVLAKIKDAKLEEYVGIEVQSIDVTGNYRDAWHAYKNFASNGTKPIPPSEHGLNWANVHKRLIPQIIRKSLVYSRSALVKKGLYFVVPEIVYSKFVGILGDIPEKASVDNQTITVVSYGLDAPVPNGKQRALKHIRTRRFDLTEFSNRFVSGPNLPSGEDLDRTVMRILGVSGQ